MLVFAVFVKGLSGSGLNFLPEDEQDVLSDRLNPLPNHPNTGIAGCCALSRR
jgi:hypothetical protein